MNRAAIDVKIPTLVNLETTDQKIRDDDRSMVERFKAEHPDKADDFGAFAAWCAKQSK